MEGVDGRPEHVIEAVEGSLKRLNIETIDVLYQHRPDPAVPIEETVGAMADLVTVGKVKYLFRRLLPRFQQEAIAHNLKLVEALTQMAEARGCAPAQLALAWLLAQGDDIVPIPGARRIKHLEENAAASALVMSQEELGKLHQLLTAHDVAGARYGANTKSFLDTHR